MENVKYKSSAYKSKVKLFFIIICGCRITYRWKQRYNGTIESLRDLSKKPYHHPNQHTEQEIKLISDIRRRNPDAGLVVFWVKLRQHGYSRSIPGLYRFLRKQKLMSVKPPNPGHLIMRKQEV